MKSAKIVNQLMPKKGLDKRALISTLGLSPGVVTGAYFALERFDYGRMDKVVTVTTGTARAKSCERLVEQTLLAADPDINYRPVRATTKETLGSSEDTERFLASMEKIIGQHIDEGYEVFLILTGGRKSMVAATVIAVQKFTFFQPKYLERIHMFHVEVMDEELEERGHISRLLVMPLEEQNLYLNPEPSKVQLVQVPVLPLVKKPGKLWARLFEYATGAYLVEKIGYQQVLYSYYPTYLQMPERGEVDVLAERVEIGPASHINRGQLRHLLVYHFCIEELKSLSSDLGLDNEELPPHPKSSLARDLVVKLEQRGQLHELFNLAKKQRPNAKWDQVHQLQALLLCECKLRIGDDPAAKPISASEVRKLVRKMAAVGEKKAAEAAGWLVTNTPYATADALDLALESSVELFQAVLPGNWKERADWKISGHRPLEMEPR